MLAYTIQFYREIGRYFRRAIHPRRLIIASDKKLVQFTVGVPLQLCVLLLLSFGILWSAYATGCFVATRSTLEAQSRTIRSVTNKKANGNFDSLLTASSFPDVNNAKMVVLEQQVAELKKDNEIIVQRVREKTDGQIEQLESIVSQTGLSPSSIKKQAEKYKDVTEGGPYIPEKIPKISEETSKLFTSLDELKTMRQVVANLPLSTPVKDAEERSGFGHRIDPFNGSAAFHSGIDIAGQNSSPIRSTADGTVVAAGREGSYGNMIDIDHGFRVVTRYGHLSEIKVHIGDKVKKGDIIGVQGSTGRSTGSHLHYEIRVGGEAVNPQKFLQTGRLLELGNVVSQN